MIFLSELDINITNHVVSQVVANVKVFNLSILAKLFKQIFIEVLEVALDLAGVKGLALRVNTGGDHIRALVHIRQN